ncbi:hypothetical protein J6590_000999 [Homalodisca vitripennis]|nr:hypothetical protein J6590_000999 [Homalodisca vitripennis]
MITPSPVTNEWIIRQPYRLQVAIIAGSSDESPRPQYQKGTDCVGIEKLPGHYAAGSLVRGILWRFIGCNEISLALAPILNQHAQRILPAHTSKSVARRKGAGDISKRAVQTDTSLPVFT